MSLIRAIYNHTEWEMPCVENIACWDVGGRRECEMHEGGSPICIDFVSVLTIIRGDKEMCHEIPGHCAPIC